MADYTQIIQEINTNLPDNTTQLITAAKVRETLTDMVNAFGETDNRIEDILPFKQDVLDFDATPTPNSTNPVVSDGIYQALQEKEDSLTFDTTPAPRSVNPVTSDGIYNSLSGKADKVSNPTSGNFAGLDANGNITDSGSKASNFATAAQGAKADNAILFVEQDALTDQQRNTALANVSNQTANSTTGKMGYKVLDPTKTFAEQVTSENTIYEIRNVFDLGGTQENPVSVTIPNGCILRFNGGVIKNCTLVNAYIDAAREKIFDTSVNFTNIKNATVYPEWFGAVADGTTNNSTAFEKAVSLGKTISIGCGTYLVTNQLSCMPNTSFIGENKRESIVKTNGIILNLNSVVSNVTISSISKTTPFLLKVSNSITDSIQYYLRINIYNVYLSGAGFNDYDTEIYGIVFECESNSNNTGFYGVNVTNIDFSGRFLYAIYFNAVDSDAWITYVNFENIFINNAKYPIEFTSVRDLTDNTFYNFQGIYFRNVCAQYNYNTSVTPSVGWTDSFIRIQSLSGGLFDACNCVDAPNTIKEYYFKSKHSSISIVNAPQSDLFNNIGKYDDSSVDEIFAQNINTIPTSMYSQYTSRIKFTEISSINAPNYSVSPISTIATLMTSTPNSFTGIRFSNNFSVNANNNYKYIGISTAGYIVHSKPIAPGDPIKLSRVYSTGYIPTRGTSEGLPTINDYGGLARGAFIYWTPFGHLLCFDTYTGNWNDALGIRITNNVTKRKGTTAERIAMTMYSYNNGFLFYDTDLKKYVLWNGSVWTNVDGSTLALTKGADTDRPTLTSVDAGFQYFDTTLGKYICWNGTTWVNLDGTALS